MKTKALSIFVLFVGLACLSPTISSADDWNKAATIVLKSPTEVPGQVLPAGAYVFKLLDDDYNRHIVQIWNAEQTKIVATVLATTRVLLEKAPADRLVMFEDRGTGQPPAVKVWLHSGDYYGEEFSYPAKKK